MKIAIDQIQVDENARIRKDAGSLKPLENSISKVGLINPILIDENRNLVAGYRRLSACRNLGFKEVEVKVVDFSGDRMKMLDVEVAENFFRKDFTPEEILSTERRRQEIREEMRKKGPFERFWLWLKNLFSSKPEAAEAPAAGESGRQETRPPASDAAEKAIQRNETVAKNNSRP